MAIALFGARSSMVLTAVYLTLLLSGSQALTISEELGAKTCFDGADFTSYFAEEPLKSAKEAYEQGRYNQAAQLLENEVDSRPVRFLKAMTASRLKQNAVAASAFASLATDWPELRNYFLMESGRSWERMAQWEAAFDAYSAIDEKALSYPTARLAIAKVQARRRLLSAAEATLEEFIRSDNSRARKSYFLPLQREVFLPAARLQLAQLAQKRGDLRAEQRALLSLWAMHPDSPEARGSSSRINKWAFTTPWKVTRAESLIALHRNQEGLTILDKLKLPDLPDEVTCRAQLALGTAHRKERHHAKAIEALRPVIEHCTSELVRPKALYVLGYSEGVLQPAVATATYESLARDYPQHPLADDALFMAAQLHSRLDQDAQALANLETIEAHYQSGDYAAEALFKLFWIQRDQGDLAKAMATLGKIEGLNFSHEHVQRARYWRARTLSSFGRVQEAQAVLQQVAEEGVAGYYGYLARSRLQEVAKEPSWNDAPEASVWPIDAGAMASDPHFRAGIELLRLGHRQFAAELLRVERKGLSEASVRLLFHILWEQGDATHAGIVARVFLREGLSPPTPAEARVLYSAAYPKPPLRSMVEKHSRAAGVDPDLMLALIREESGFNPRARSSTGALGLSQLMPRTAAEVARALKAPRVSLLNPSGNVRLGSAYLGSLQRRFEGNAAHAIASYNAGPNAVNRWLERSDGADLDEWVEDIPVDETRGYVKRVLGSYATYQFLGSL